MEDRKPIYAIGDKVKIVKYGHPYWVNKDGDIIVKDMSPELIGQKGLVDEVTITQGIPMYAIDGIKGKHAWYNEDQMELISE